MDSFCSMGTVSGLLDGKSLRPLDNVNMVNSTELLKNGQDGKCLVFTTKNIKTKLFRVEVDEKKFKQKTSHVYRYIKVATLQINLDLT